MEAKTKILVVDDVEAIRRCFRMFLEKVGYQVVEAVNGLDGIEVFTKESPDVILTDLQMPEMDGLKFIASLKDYIKSTPVIVISGEGGVAEAIEAVRLGAWEYIIKPVNDMRVLAVAIQRVLEKGRLLKENQQYREGLEQRVLEQTKELREIKDRYEIVCEQTGQLIYDYDICSGHIFWSGAIEQVTGYSSLEFESVQIHRWAQMMHPDEEKAVVKQFLNSRHVTGQYCVEHKLQKKCGSYIHVKNHGVCCPDANGKTVRMLGAIEDISESKRAENKLRRHVNNLAALRAIDMAISGSMEFRTTLKVLLDELVAQLQVDTAFVMLLSQQSRTLEYASGVGLNSNIDLNGISIENSFAGQVDMVRKNLIIPDLKTDKKFSRNELVKAEGFRSFVGIPLVAKGELKGVLEIFNRTKFHPDQEWLDFAEALAGQAAIAIENAEMLEHMQRSNRELMQAYDSTIEGWSRALDYRDKETEGHSRRVTDLTVKIARSIGISHERLAHMRRGALLHDIGKLGVPDSILLKPGKLTDEEFEVIKKHPEIAFRVLSPIEFLRPALDIPYWHHEKWDGSGYPHGLKGEEIPLAARIFAVVDVWDALRSDRPYRPAWPAKKVLDYMAGESGKHFDPVVLNIFVELMGSGESS
jgi:PAS domain S-box-containing protein